jgi:hypothetical protein
MRSPSACRRSRFSSSSDAPPGQRGDAPIVQVGRCLRHVAQRGDLELAEVAVLQVHVAGLGGIAGPGVGMPATAGCGCCCKAWMPPWRPGSTTPGRMKKPAPMSANSPLENSGPAWHSAAAAADEELQPALGGRRVARGRAASPRASASRKRSKGVAPTPACRRRRPAPWPAAPAARRRRRAAARRKLRRQRQASSASPAATGAGAPGCWPARAGRAAGAAPATTGCRPRRPNPTSARAPRSTATARCGPAPSAALRTRPAIGEGLRWQVAAGTGQARAGRQPRLEEQPLPERDGRFGPAGPGIAGSSAGAGGQGPWASTRLRSAAVKARPRRWQARAPTPTATAGPRAPRSLQLELVRQPHQPAVGGEIEQQRQRPAMCSIRPSAR